MALIKIFKAGSVGRRTLHEEISAAVSAFMIDGCKIVQIDTFGREARQYPGKKSQTIQLDEEGGRILYDILQREFGFK